MDASTFAKSDTSHSAVGLDGCCRLMVHSCRRLASLHNPTQQLSAEVVGLRHLNGLRDVGASWFGVLKLEPQFSIARCRLLSVNVVVVVQRCQSKPCLHPLDTEHLPLWHIRSLPVPITSGFDHFRFLSLPVPITSGSDHFRFRSLPVVITSGSDHFRLRLFPVPSIPGSYHFRFRSLPVPITSGSDHFRFRSLPVGITSGSDHFRLRLFPVPSIPGSHHFRFR